MFFNLFKKKKKRIDKPIELSKEDLQWNKMWECGPLQKLNRHILN